MKSWALVTLLAILATAHAVPLAKLGELPVHVADQATEQAPDSPVCAKCKDVAATIQVLSETLVDLPQMRARSASARAKQASVLELKGGCLERVGVGYR